MIWDGTRVASSIQIIVISRTHRLFRLQLNDHLDVKCKIIHGINDHYGSYDASSLIIVSNVELCAIRKFTVRRPSRQHVSLFCPGYTVHNDTYFLLLGWLNFETENWFDIGHCFRKCFIFFRWLSYQYSIVQTYFLKCEGDFCQQYIKNWTYCTYRTNHCMKGTCILVDHGTDRPETGIF